MTVEEIELRKILRSMLAEAGITRDSLREIVGNIVEKKVEEVTKNLVTSKLDSYDFAYKIYNDHRYEFRSMLERTLKDNIKDIMVSTNIVIPKGSNIHLEYKG